MPRLLTLLATLTLGLMPSLKPASAATIHINYRDFIDSELGHALVKPILTGDSALDLLVTNNLTEVLVYWEKRKAPPIIRYGGIPAMAVVETHAQSTMLRKSALGMRATLTKSLSNCSVIAYEADQLILMRTELISDTKPSEWPVLAEEYSVVGSAFPTDIKLTKQLRKHIQKLDLYWRRDNQTIYLFAETPSHENARTARSYIMRRRPWIHFGAALGVDSLEFASELLGEAKINVHETDKVLLRSQLHGKLLPLTTSELAKLIGIQLDKYLGVPKANTQ